MYRRTAQAVVGRTIAEVDANDEWFCKGSPPSSFHAALQGQVVVAARRRGKLLLLDCDDGPTLGIRFGMTGRLVVDGSSPIAALEYGAKRTDSKWDRFALGFADGGRLVVNDPRRLGGVQLSPDERLLGFDAYSVSLPELIAVLLGSNVAVKARLLDQSRLAGVGNLLADETMWRAGLDPARPCRSLSVEQIADIHRALGLVLQTLMERGGSHTGELQAERHHNGVCPLDGASLLRRTIGGRTTYSCSIHQV